MNVLITGATGYLGDKVHDMFFCKNNNVVCFGNNLKYPHHFSDVIDGFDILINCAGVQGPVGTSETTDSKEIEITSTVNYLSPVCLMNAVLPSMRRNNFGRIINISGGGAADSRPNYAAYAASKAALVRYSECVADECKGYNITVNCVAPGKMNSKLAGNITTEKESEANRARAVELIYALTTPEYSHVTGRLIAARWDDWREFPNVVLPPGKYKLRRTT